MRSAADVAATLEVRGYGVARPSATMHEPWSRHDLAFLASAAGLVALAVWAGIAGTFGWHPYPTLHVPAGAGPIAGACAIAIVALAPFAERRGIAR